MDSYTERNQVHKKYPFIFAFCLISNVSNLISISINLRWINYERENIFNHCYYYCIYLF